MIDEALVRSAARERQFEAELAAVLGVPLSAVTRGPGGTPRRAVWFAAAMVVLGGLITIAVAWDRGQPPSVADEPPSFEPPPLPSPYVVSDFAGFASAPRDAQNLAVVIGDARRDCASIGGFPGLRAVSLVAFRAPGLAVVDALLPVVSLPQLEVLELPLQPAMGPEYLRVLARAAGLRFLTLRLERPLQAADVEALAQLPQLGTLTLVGGQIDAASVRALADLPRLHTLSLEATVAAEDALVQLRAVPRLRGLRLERMGHVPLARRLGSAVAEGVGLTPVVAQALAALPRFVALELCTCEVSAAAVAALPERLEHFSLTWCPDAGAEVLSVLQRFRALRSLGLSSFQRTVWMHGAPGIEPRWGPGGIDAVIAELPDQGPCMRMQAELLRQLPLRRLSYIGPLPSPLHGVLPRVQELSEVALQWVGPFDLATVARVQTLRSLRLANSMLELEHLRPLADLPLLERLRLERFGWTRADVEALLPGVLVSLD